MIVPGGKAGPILSRRAALGGGALFATTGSFRSAWSAPGIPDVTLVDQDGVAWPLRALLEPGVPTVISFFFVLCSTICPPQTATLRELRDELSARRRPGPDPLLVSIALDPLGDTPPAIRDYAKRFEVTLGRAQGWMMLTGQRAALLPVWRAFEAPVDRPDTHAPVLWLGRNGAWRRVSALSPAATLADMLDRPG